MGGTAAGKGFEYQDLCALYRVILLYEPGTGQIIQVEDRRSPAGAAEPWDIRVVNPAAKTHGFCTELWQAKNTAVSRKLCCEYWRSLHLHIHQGELGIAAQAKIRQDTLLGIVTSAKIQGELERFRQFLECLRDYDQMPDRHDFEDAWREDYKGVDLDGFVKAITAEQVTSLALLDFASRNNGGVHWFRRFTLEEWSAGSLRDRIEVLCGRHLGLRLIDDKAGFDRLCGGAVSLIRSSYGSPLAFDEVIAAITEDSQHHVPRRSLVQKILQSQKNLVEKTEGLGQPALRHLFVEPAAVVDVDGGVRETAHAENWLRNAVVAEKVECRFMLLLGDFGHGKTTLLKLASANLAAQWKAGDAIPVFVPLRIYFESNTNVPEMVADALAEHVTLDKETWNTSRWIVFCDGFDELNATHQDRPDWIRSRFHRLYAASRNSNVTIVVSSRPILFLDPEVRAAYLQPFPKTRLLPFDPPRIKTWLKKWNKSLTYAELKKRNLEVIASTPVILLLIAQLKEARGLKAERYSRAKIYAEFFAWVKDTGGPLETGESFAKHEPIPSEVLQKIAVHLFAHPESQAGMISVPVLLNELNDKSASSPLGFDNRLFVRHAFRESKTNYVEFLHQSLREFLLAEYCFEALFRRTSDDPYTLEFAADHAKLLELDRPLTAAVISFFRELVEDVAEDDGALLMDNIVAMKRWPALLADIIGQTGSRSVTREFFRRGPSAKPERTASRRAIEIVVGNCALLTFAAQIYFTDRAEVYDDDRVEALSSLLAFFASQPSLSPLRDTLSKSLTKVRFNNGGDFWGVDFSDFDFHGGQFDSVQFHNCRFDNLIFENCKFVNCRFHTCSFTDTFDGRGSVFTNTKFILCIIQRGFFGSNDSGVEYDRCVFPARLRDRIAGAPAQMHRFEQCMFSDLDASTKA